MVLLRGLHWRGVMLYITWTSDALFLALEVEL